MDGQVQEMTSYEQHIVPTSPQTPSPSNSPTITTKQVMLCLICRHVFDETYPACPVCHWD